jgi:hypothetical protein
LQVSLIALSSSFLISAFCNQVLPDSYTHTLS